MPLFGQGRVAHAREGAGVLPLELTPGSIELPRALGVVNHVVEIPQSLFADEGAQDVHVAVGHAVGGEDVVVGDDDDLVLVPDLGVLAELPMEHADGPRPANVVGEQDVGVDPNVVAGLDAGPSAGAGEDGFGECHYRVERHYDTTRLHGATGFSAPRLYWVRTQAKRLPERALHPSKSGRGNFNGFTRPYTLIFDE